MVELGQVHDHNRSLKGLKLIRQMERASCVGISPHAPRPKQINNRPRRAGIEFALSPSLVKIVVLVAPADVLLFPDPFLAKYYLPGPYNNGWKIDTNADRLRRSIVYRRRWHINTLPVAIININQFPVAIIIISISTPVMPVSMPISVMITSSPTVPIIAIRGGYVYTADYCG